MEMTTMEMTSEEKKSLKDFLLKLKDGKNHTMDLFTSAYIYKVPEHLKKLNQSAYIPRFVAIGPLHRNDKRLQGPMQSVKRYYTSQLIERHVEGLEGKDKKAAAKTKLVEECMKKMREKTFLEKVRKYYATDVKMDDDDQMREMLLEDGCFILELLYSSVSTGNSKTSKGSGGGSSEPRLLDPISDILLTKAVIKYDLLLLENQIPFFVLEELFELTVKKIPERENTVLTDYVRSYFKGILDPNALLDPKAQDSGSKKTGCPRPGDCCVLSISRCTEQSGQELEEGSHKDKQYRHILHLIHDYYLPDGKMDDREMFTGTGISASDLSYAGVKFTPFEGKNLFDVKFEEPPHIRWWLSRAEFKIPTLIVDESTESILRNFIAMEQCCPGVQRHFTSYAMFMDLLINSNKDVQVLKKAKVIRNNLGSDVDVSHLFNKLCKGIVAGELYFNKQYQDAFDYSKHRWPKMLAYWKRTYHASPWKFKASLLALIAFLIAVTQFIRTFLK